MCCLGAISIKTTVKLNKGFCDEGAKNVGNNYVFIYFLLKEQSNYIEIF